MEGKYKMLHFPEEGYERGGLIRLGKVFVLGLLIMNLRALIGSIFGSEN